MTVDRERRAALVASRLNGSGPHDVAWLYRGLETNGTHEAHQILGPAYGQVVLLSGYNLTTLSLVAALDQLASSRAVVAIDVLLLVHGHDQQLVFSDSEIRSAASVAGRIMETDAVPKLRLLYTTASYGASLAPPLLEAGFSTVIGASRKNTTGIGEFRSLLGQWTAGASASRALARADRAGARRVRDTMARILGRVDDVDSRKVLVGDPDLTIGSPPGSM
jgi:hypothetical protein